MNSICIPAKGAIMAVLLFAVFTLTVAAQGVLYIHQHDTCMAVQVIDHATVSRRGDYIVFNGDVVFRKDAVDSITFVEPQRDCYKAGWWGDMYSGYSLCYYRPVCCNLPDMVVLAEDGICYRTVYCLALTDDCPSARLHKVGRKWRYVKNTLSGHRKFHLSFFDSLSYGSFEECTNPFAEIGGVIVDSGDACFTPVYLDISNLFYEFPSSVVRQVASYWHRPQYAPLPPSPVFGLFDGNDYHVGLKAGNRDLLQCQITLDTDYNRDVCYGDTIHLIFPNAEVARNEFNQMDTTPDMSTSFFLSDNEILIAENFVAAYSEVVKWLVRFDLEFCKPVFIQDDEE